MKPDPAPTRTGRRRVWLLGGLLVLTIGVPLALKLTGLDAWFSEERLRGWLAPYGPFAVVGLYVLGVAALLVGCPRNVLTGAGALLLGFWPGLLASCFSALTIALGWWGLGRAGRAKGVDDAEELLRKYHIPSDRGVWMVLQVRQLPLPGPVLSVILGNLGVPLPKYVVGTLLGYLPLAIPAALIGVGISADDPLIRWLSLGFGAVSAILVVVLMGRWVARVRAASRRGAAPEPTEPPPQESETAP